MTKTAIREMYKQKRIALKDSEFEKLNDLLLIQFQKEPFPFFHSILSYFPLEFNKEPDTFLITRYLKFLNPQIQIAYPTMINSVDMKAVVITNDSEFVPNKYGIMELQDGEIVKPNELDAVLVPMLQCDYNGNRVGYGKGYYDRYLAECKSDVLKIGLSLFDVIEKVDDANSFDIPLSHCITPHIVYEF